MKKNCFPFTELGVLARMEETQKGYEPCHLAPQFGVDNADMRNMLVKLLKEGRVKTFTSQKHLQYCALTAHQYEQVKKDPFALPAYVRPPMTAESARRAGTFWTLAETLRR